MKKAILILLLLNTSFLIIAQSNNESKKDKTELDNTTTFSINPKNKRQVTFKVSAPKTRYLKKRTTNKKVKQVVTFNEATEIPLFNICENELDRNKLICFNTQMARHVEKHFNYPEEAIDNEIEGNVWVNFIIDSKGNINSIETKDSDTAEILNKEAKRVISILPKLIPGKKGSETVAVKYGFEIAFSLGEDEE